MKKILKASILSFALLFLLTGCESTAEKKTLSCTMSEDTNDMFSMTQTVETVISDNKATNINQNIKMNVNADYVAYIEAMAQGVRDQYADVQGKDGVEFDVKVEGNVISTTLNAELDKLDDETKTRLSMNGSDSLSYEAAKKSMEKSGYTCK